MGVVEGGKNCIGVGISFSPASKIDSLPFGSRLVFYREERKTAKFSERREGGFLRVLPGTARQGRYRLFAVQVRCNLSETALNGETTQK